MKKIEKNLQKNSDAQFLSDQRKLAAYHFFIADGTPVIPGIVRMRDAPFYLGVNKTFFRDSVQPYLTRIPIDKKGIGFCRMELDRWIAYTKATVGHPPEKQPPWEISDDKKSESSAPIFTTASDKNLPQKKVKKKSFCGKPTASDLEKLVSQITVR